jgi:hypothetical protein
LELQEPVIGASPEPDLNDFCFSRSILICSSYLRLGPNFLSLSCFLPKLYAAIFSTCVSYALPISSSLTLSHSTYRIQVLEYYDLQANIRTCYSSEIWLLSFSIFQYT